MTYKTTTMQLILILLITLTISAQDTLTIVSDTIKTDSNIVIEQTEEIMIEQRSMNNEMKRQLDFLIDILNKQDTINDPNKE